ncbi:MAG: BatA and WFA domain-containing protein, partial [Planctomycetes bacterium]|nr:BatA and WFA domain-containing protein [Planctomycetota bacterium]
MSFAQPEVLTWLWAILIVPLVYLVRRRARRKLIPHLFLWERVVTSRRRTQRRRLRNILSVVLQMAIAATLILAWAGPLATASRRVPGHVLIFLDVSASMAARQSSGVSRLETAKAMIRTDLEACLAHGAVTLVFVAEDARLGCGRSNDPARLASSLAGGSISPGDFEPQAIEQFTRAVRARDPGVVARVYTDGAFLEAPSFARRYPEFAWRVVRGDLPNAGITAVEALTAQGEDAMRLAVAVASFGSDCSARIVVRTEDGVERSGSRLRLEDGGMTRVELEFAATPAERLRLHLEREDGRDDALARDDVVSFAARRSPRARILVVAEVPDPHLLRALAALPHLIDTAGSGRTTPADWRRAAADHDLIVLQGLDEKQPLPPGEFLLLDSWAPGLGLDRGARLKEVAVDRKSGVG